MSIFIMPNIIKLYIKDLLYLVLIYTQDNRYNAGENIKK